MAQKEVPNLSQQGEVRHLNRFRCGVNQADFLIRPHCQMLLVVLNLAGLLHLASHH